MAGGSSKKKLRKTLKNMGPPQKQYFSFPPDVIRYLWKNPVSPNGILKLYKCCKYFFLKRPILIVPKNITINENTVKFGQSVINFQRINAEFWFHCKIIAVMNFFKRFEKILRCTVTHLQIKESLLALEDFDILVAEKSVKYFYFRESSILYPDGTNVPFDVVFPKTPNVILYYYLNDHEKYLSETLRKLNSAKIYNWNKLQHLALNLDTVAETFDPVLFSQFIMKNTNSYVRVDIGLRGNNAEQIKASLELQIRYLFSKWQLKKPKLHFHVRLPTMANIMRHYFDDYLMTT